MRVLKCCAVLVFQSVVVLAGNMSSVENVATPNMIIATLKKGLDSFTDQISASQQFMSSNFDRIVDDFAELCKEVRSLRRENTELRNTVALLDEKFKSLSHSVHCQEKRMDDYCRESISCNAIVSGIPRIANEDTAMIVEKTLSVVSPNITMQQVKRCERLPTTKHHRGTPPIRVIFNNADTKQKFVRAKIDHGKVRAGSIVRCHGRADVVSVRSELSPLKIELLRELKLSQEKMRFSYVWASTAGEILVRVNKSSKPVVIRSRADILKLTTSRVH